MDYEALCCCGHGAEADDGTGACMVFGCDCYASETPDDAAVDDGP